MNVAHIRMIPHLRVVYVLNSSPLKRTYANIVKPCIGKKSLFQILIFYLIKFFSRHSTKFHLIKSAHEGTCETYRLYLPSEFTTNFGGCLDYAYEKTLLFLQYLLSVRRYLRVSLNVSLRFSKDNSISDDEFIVGQEEKEVITYNITPKAKRFMFGVKEHTRQKLTDLFSQISERFNDFNHRGSGWVLADCLYLDINVGQCLSLQGSCSIHKVKNNGEKITVLEDQQEYASVTDHRCFYHGIANVLLANEKRAKGYDKPENTTVQEMELFIERNIHETVKGPVSIDQVSSIEKANAHLDLGINIIYRADDGKVYPAYPSPNIHAKNQIVLLLFHRRSDPTNINDTHEDEDMLVEGAFSVGDYGDTASLPYVNIVSDLQATMHYAPVHDIDQLFANKQTQYDCVKKQTTTVRTVRKNFCFNCFNSFSTVDSLGNHIKWCHTQKGQIYRVPQPGSVIEFTPKRKSFKLGYTFFFDFETRQATPHTQCPCGNIEIASCTHKTKIVSEQYAIAYSLLCMDRDNKIYSLSSYIGEDAADHFIDALMTLEEQILDELKSVEPISLTNHQLFQHEMSTNCHICGEAFDDTHKNYRKVADHDHISGAYIGPAHSLCNLHRSEMTRLVGFAHNFSGYDSHILMPALAKKKLELEAIPLNTEKFKMLRISKCTILDSMAFLSAPLDKLVNTLKQSEHTFPIMNQWLIDQQQLTPISASILTQKELLLRKGVYPYEYMDDIARCRETSLPPPSAFSSRLTGKEISNEDYAHAQKTWKTMEMKNLGDYTRLYVTTDTIQLAEAITDLRDRIYNEYQLDLCHYLSLPMLSKDIMLKISGVKMGLMSDLEQIWFVKSSIRGGLSYVGKRHTTVDDSAQEKSILYADASEYLNVYFNFIFHSFQSLSPLSWSMSVT